MAIAFDNAQKSTPTASGGTGTASYTATGSNITLLVFVNETTTGKVTSISWNGTGMTKITGSEIDGGPGTGWLIGYYLPAAASGTHNVVVTTSDTGTIFIFIASYTGTSSSQPDAVANVTNAVSSVCNGSITTVADNSWPVMWVQAASGTITAGVSTNLRLGPAGFGIGILDIGAKTPAGSATINSNNSSNVSRAANLISLAPSPTQNLTLTAAVGTFVVTGNASTLGRIFTLVAASGSFILSGIAAILKYTPFPWKAESKNSGSWSAESKNTGTWNAQSKNTGVWNPESKH